MGAIERAWSDDGVLVLMDLGSAVLSAEMALDLLGDDRRDRILLCEAPLVEGAVAAAVTAKLGSPLDAVAREARAGLAGKATHLGVPTEREPGSSAEEHLGDVGDAVTTVAVGRHPARAPRAPGSQVRAGGVGIRRDGQRPQPHDRDAARPTRRA